MTLTRPPRCLYDLKGAFDVSTHHCRFCSAQRLGPDGAVLNAITLPVAGHQTVRGLEFVGLGMMYICSARYFCASLTPSLILLLSDSWRSLASRSFILGSPSLPGPPL